ncbi:MAG: preprotein translocase subunit SecE [Wenzhouxiangella sp.]|nr:preprotein translocase subunit SecE [Wenzhouxiangella sp.]
MAAEKTSPRDNMLWAVGLLVLLAGVVGFFHFAGEVMTLFRVLGLLAALGVALAIVGRTDRGRMMFSFMRETDVERRKVVWPNRQETLQTTLMVLVITVIVAILLFLMDTLFGWIVRRLIGVSGGS